MQRSKIVLLPEDLRAELDRRLLAGHFTDYTELAGWLKDLGHAIGKSSIHRYGVALERRLTAAGMPVESTISGKRAAARARQITGSLVIVIDPVSRQTWTYSSPLTTALLNARIARAVGAEGVGG